MPVEIIRERFQFFQNLSPQDCENFLRFCKQTRVESGKSLWEEGDTDNFAAFILNGKLGIKKQTEFSGRYVIVGIYTSGSVVGELCLLTQNPRSVTAEVIEPSEVLLLHSQDFEKMLQQFPMLGLALLRHIFIATSKRLSKSYERIVSIF
jgi:CRP-like cAMP-binding protein